MLGKYDLRPIVFSTLNLIFKLNNLNKKNAEYQQLAGL